MTLGPEVAEVARSLGIPFLPWQAAVSDVANEVVFDSDGELHFAYPIVVLLVPRQAGKSTLMLSHQVHRARTFPAARCWFTSHTRAMAASMLVEEWQPILDNCPDLKDAYTVRTANGTEGIHFDTGGRVNVFAPTRNSLHSKQADLAQVDEAWKFDSVAGSELLAGIRPTQYTRPMRQLWIVSAGGDQDSTWLLDWREKGRQLQGDTSKGIAYFEWAPRQDPESGEWLDDLDDPETWARVHPGVAGGLIPLDALRADYEAETDKANFYRPVLNVFDGVQEVKVRSLFNLAEWQAASGDTFDLTAPGLYVSYDVAPYRRDWSVSVARRLQDGRTATMLAGTGNDPEVCADFVQEVRKSYGAKVVADGTGAQSTVTRMLTERGVQVRTLSTSEVADAIAELRDDLAHGRYVHANQEPVNDAVEATVPRLINNGKMAMLGAVSKGADITPVGSLVPAFYAARHIVQRVPVVYASSVPA